MTSKSSCSDFAGVHLFLRPESSGVHQVSLRGRNTTSEITHLGLEGLAAGSELDQTRLQTGLLHTSRFHGKCQIARLRLAPGSKFFVNSVSLQTFGLDLPEVPTQGADQSRQTEQESLH